MMAVVFLLDEHPSRERLDHCRHPLDVALRARQAVVGVKAGEHVEQVHRLLELLRLGPSRLFRREDLPRRIDDVEPGLVG